jgi:hypothetical protein
MILNKYVENWFLAQLILIFWKWAQYFPPEKLPLNGLHQIIAQNMVVLKILKF